jgi:hypothetical protein
MVNKDSFSQYIVPKITWLEKPPDAILDGLRTIKSGEGLGVIYSVLGCGHQTYLRWGKQELLLADKASDQDEIDRHKTNSILHAKRCIECLFDQYLRRDWFEEVIPPNFGFSRKLELLGKRPVLAVPKTLIPRIISEPRNTAEHEYVTPQIEDVKVAVEAAEAVTAFLENRSDPHVGYALCGHFFKSIYSSKTERVTLFTGFDGPFASTWKGVDGVVRVCAGVPSAKDAAEIQWCNIQNFSTAQHLELLEWWDSRPDTVKKSCASEVLVRDDFFAAGVDSPNQNPLGRVIVEFRTK